MISSSKLSAFLVGSLMLLAALSPALALTGSITAPSLNAIGVKGVAESTNWSGYAETGTSVTSVSGTWTVPTIATTWTGYSSSNDYFSAVWVGIDGYSDSTVEQTGILSETISGVTSYFAWYEFYPSAMQQITTATSGGSATVLAGDTISASVAYVGTTTTTKASDMSSSFFSGPVTFNAPPSNSFSDPGRTRTTTEFTVTISDTRNGVLQWTYTNNVSTTSTPLRTSAEWIVETPEVSIDGRPATLAYFPDFTSVTFTSPAAAPTTLSAPIPITMVNEKTGATMATPSATSSPATYTVTWVSQGP